MVSNTMITYRADELSRVYVTAHLPVSNRLPALGHFLSIEQAGGKDCSCCIFILFDLSRVLFHTHTLKFTFPSVNVILISFYFWQQIPLQQKLFILCPTIFGVEAEIQHDSWRRAVWGKLGAHTLRLDPREVWIVAKIRNVWVLDRKSVV